MLQIHFFPDVGFGAFLQLQQIFLNQIQQTEETRQEIKGHYSSELSIMGILQPYSEKSEASRIDVVCISITVDNLQSWHSHSKSCMLGKHINGQAGMFIIPNKCSGSDNSSQLNVRISFHNSNKILQAVHLLGIIALLLWFKSFCLQSYAMEHDPRHLINSRTMHSLSCVMA